MENDFDKFSGFQWDRGNTDKNLIKHNVENWECEQVFFNKPILVLDKDGFHYKGEVIEDAGEAHRIFIEVMTKLGQQR